LGRKEGGGVIEDINRLFLNNHSSKILMRKLLVLALLSIIYTCSSYAFCAKVTHVRDGDTFVAIVIDKNNNTIPVCIRLWGVDCPERREKFYPEAKKFTEDLIFKDNDSIVIIKPVSHKEWKSDHREPIDWEKPFPGHNRLVAEVFVGDKNLGIELLKKGLAMLDIRYCRDCDYLKSEKVAKDNELKIWRENCPVRPHKKLKSQFDPESVDVLKKLNCP